MVKWVILLRGVNVGGNTVIKMAELREQLEAAGFTAVKTLLQSGNIVVGSELEDRASVADAVARVLSLHFGMSSKVIVLSSEEWSAIETENPFPQESESKGKWVQVYFGSDSSQRKLAAEFASRYAGPEKIVPTDNAIFVFFPIGIGVSALFKEKQWAPICVGLTARNWNTFRKISVELGR
ncbi:MAG TPA: DUF1697 domain-containing protein [Fimbriimonas sp.]|nr:DUF1697 domain-containing protein [Fimbriimonas sp.]